ncbi:hypothetical protein FJK98_32050 [Micromonospora sp. HM134]|uniref:hypothetical protein n=1 Tax=Micromonospora sp. HM134 TaxID=2583243 RepID=UPI001198BCB8|nr:hypothetical protein [Micromonospora sp. HM134]QDY11202.1 hypothetical protein FJK98_32050 [Micromonospora sp. HM134]
MISELCAATVRHRHVVLLLGLLVAIVNAATIGLTPSLGQILFIPLILITLAVLAVSVIAMGIRPASFVVLPHVPAFATPPPAWKVFLALGVLWPNSASLGALVRSTRADIVSTLDVVLALAWVVAVTLLLIDVWRDNEVQLRPYGIRQSWPLGSLTVPWEALPAAQLRPGTDRPSRLRMAFAQPLLVKRRGIPWSRNALRTDNVDARFLAAAIRHYVCRPEYRPAIGSQAEYKRLLIELANRQDGADRAD